MAENKGSGRLAITAWLLALVSIWSLCVPASSVAQDHPGGLPPQYKTWLEEEVAYIISPLEKKVFLSLTADKERDAFITAFWRQRNPSLLADRNPFKEEHYRRIEFANKQYRRTASVPGWKTDRGRIYIMLGPPLSIDRYDNVSVVYPIEVWNYRGMSQYGLPDVFHLIFFRRFGVGDYQLYSPLADGPQSLMMLAQTDQTGTESALEELRKESPVLAQLSLSLVPGEILNANMPSLTSDRLLLSLDSAPYAVIEKEYATRFARNRGIVDVDYSANYVGNESLVRIIRDKSGISFVNYLVELDRFSVESANDKYVTRLALNGRITDADGKAVYQFERSIPLEFSAEQIGQMRAQHCSVQDMFPLIEGSYQFDLLVKNEASKEFTSLDTKIVVPSGDTVSMNQMVLAYKQESAAPSAKARAFLAGGRQFYPAPRKDFATGDSLIAFFQLFGLSEDLKKNGACTITILRGEVPFRSETASLADVDTSEPVVREFRLADFVPDYYRIRVALLDQSRREILHDEQDFVVTHAASVPRPWISQVVHAGPADPAYLTILGTQFLNKGEPDKAKPLLEKAFRLNPASPPIALNYAQALFDLKGYASVIEVLTSFNPDEYPQTLDLLGRSCHALGDFRQAALHFQAWLSHFGANSRIYGLLGDCHVRLGRTEEALKAWEKSLEMNPDQPDLKLRIDSLRKE